MNPEKKFWYEIKNFNVKNNCKLSFTLVENTASWGTPDILGYNANNHFFTIELKVTKSVVGNGFYKIFCSMKWLQYLHEGLKSSSDKVAPESMSSV